jgi:hypothetical protein
MLVDMAAVDRTVTRNLGTANSAKSTADQFVKDVMPIMYECH